MYILYIPILLSIVLEKFRRENQHKRRRLRYKFKSFRVQSIKLCGGAYRAITWRDLHEVVHSHAAKYALRIAVLSHELDSCAFLRRMRRAPRIVAVLADMGR